ncbi:MAG: hypothetical protein ACK5N8_06680 [Alphaproteobacteria bacterium]
MKTKTKAFLLGIAYGITSYIPRVIENNSAKSNIYSYWAKTGSYLKSSMVNYEKEQKNK